MMTDWNSMEEQLAAAGAPALLRLLMSADCAPEEKQFLRPILTGPSVLRGARDLSEWGRNHRAVRAMLAGTLERLFEYAGRGVGEAFSAEVLYERGNFLEALPEALAAEQSPIAEIACTGGVLAARVDPGAAKGHLASARAAAAGDGMLCPGLEAAGARIAAYRGAAAAMEAWLEADRTDPGAADVPANWYPLLARGFVLIALGRAEQAEALYDALCRALRNAARPLDYAEALCGAAIARGDIAPVRQALALLAPYRYRMLCAEFGAPMAELLEKEEELSETAQAARDFAARWSGESGLVAEAEPDFIAEGALAAEAEPVPAAEEEPPDSPAEEERRSHPKGRKRG